MNERRRYFRIEDEFQVRFTPTVGGATRTPDVPSEARELGQALTRLWQKLPEAAEAIEMIARRVAMLEQHSESDSLSPAELVQGANISGCGLAFFSRRPLTHGRLFDLDLYLESGAVQLRAVGRVVACETLKQSGKPGGPGCLVRVDFVQIEPEDEETLVQYVLRRQLRQLRKGRELQEQQPSRKR